MSDEELKNKLLALRRQVDMALAILKTQNHYHDDSWALQADWPGAMFAIGDFVIFPRNE